MTDFYLDESPNQKRIGGATTDNGDWLVLTESKQLPNGSWVHQCGYEIMSAKVAHTIMGPFAGAGFGECAYTNTPYCPTCEIKPDCHGKPDNRGVIWAAVEGE